MRFVRFIAVVAWAGVALLAVAGFAAFSPGTTDATAVQAAPSEAVTGVTDARGGVAGLVAAQAFSGRQVESTGPGVAEFSETAELEVFARLVPPQIIATTTTTTTSSTTTTTVAPTTTTAPPTTTTPTTAPPPSPTSIPGDGTVEATGGVGPCGASYYGAAFAGKTTANGESFDPNAMTAATHFVDFNTVVTVTRVDTGASVQVRINDRGPYMSDLKTRHSSRCIDLSTAAMEALSGTGAGVIQVTLTMPADTNGLARLQAKYGAL
ncbi:MAG: septal ring lytic transglycosylase RlpA family protein [Acidimicrobiia bacterium]|nr:septal ring lytic transglycosylase RlpA family protein [Acidimicrobiia bacterium]